MRHCAYTPPPVLPERTLQREAHALRRSRSGETNTGDQETLEYTCTCTNGTEPGLQYYDSSLFSLVCQEAFKQCTNASAGDPVELPKCKDDIQARCGTLSISNLPDEKSDGSGDDKSGGDEESGSDGGGAEGGGDGGSEEDEGDGAGMVLRPAWGTAVVGAAIGAVAVFL